MSKFIVECTDQRCETDDFDDAKSFAEEAASEYGREARIYQHIMTIKLSEE